VIAGTSAGAAIMSATMFRAPRSQFELLRDGPHQEDLGAGLGFLAGPWLVDQHFLARARHLRLLAALCPHPELAGGLGVDEDTALIIRGQAARVVGASHVARLRVERRSACAPLDVAARVDLFGPGATFDLRGDRDTGATGQTATPSAAEEAEPVLDAEAPAALLDSVRRAAEGRHAAGALLRLDRSGALSPQAWLVRAMADARTRTSGQVGAPDGVERIEGALLEVKPLQVAVGPQ